MEPLVSIIVPAHNEEETIGRVLQALSSQTYQPKEIIVVNDCSNDDTEKIVSGFEHIQQIRNERNLGLAKSMNVGLRSAKGDILMVLHADCVPASNKWIGQMVRPFADPSVGAVVSQRVIEDRDSLSLPEKLFDSIAPQQFLNKSRALTETDFFRDKCDAYRGGVIKKLGFFDDESFFVAGEDTDLSIRMRNAGYKIMLSDEAKVICLFSSHQRSLKSVLWRKSLQYGSAAALLHKRHGYDGLQTRIFLATLASLVLIPLVLISHTVGAVGYGVLFLVSLALPVSIFGKKIPLTILIIVLFWVWMMCGCWPVLALSWSVTGIFVLYLLHMALKSVRHVIRERENPLLVFPVFLFAMCWRLLSGIGFLVGYLRLLKRRETPACSSGLPT